MLHILKAKLDRRRPLLSLVECRVPKSTSPSPVSCGCGRAATAIIEAPARRRGADSLALLRELAPDVVLSSASVGRVAFAEMAPGAHSPFSASRSSGDIPSISASWQ
jgi:hypothetical protein